MRMRPNGGGSGLTTIGPTWGERGGARGARRRAGLGARVVRERRSASARARPRYYIPTFHSSRGSSRSSRASRHESAPPSRRALWTDDGDGRME